MKKTIFCILIALAGNVKASDIFGYSELKNINPPVQVVQQVVVAGVLSEAFGAIFVNDSRGRLIDEYRKEKIHN